MLKYLKSNCQERVLVVYIEGVCARQAFEVNLRGLYLDEIHSNYIINSRTWSIGFSLQYPGHLLFCKLQTLVSHIVSFPIRGHHLPIAVIEPLCEKTQLSPLPYSLHQWRLTLSCNGMLSIYCLSLSYLTIRDFPAYFLSFRTFNAFS